jgi:hypothetical protein
VCVYLCADAEAKEVVNYFAVATPFVFLIALFVVWINSEASFFLCYHTIKRFCSDGGGAESERERDTETRAAMHHVPPQPLLMKKVVQTNQSR